MPICRPARLRSLLAVLLAAALAVAVAGPGSARPAPSAAAASLQPALGALPSGPDDGDRGDGDPDDGDPDDGDPGDGDPDDGDLLPDSAWLACRDGFQCARIDVPMDYDDADAGTVSLALIRLPAADPDERLGSLFLNPGGPGGSGVDLARFAAKFLPLEVRQRYDIVGFDPRGIGLSDPVRCFATLDELFLSLPPFAFPVTQEEEKVWQESDAVLADACAERAGPMLDHMSTANVARDLDLLRRAVGDPELNFLGFSYGSHARDRPTPTSSRTPSGAVVLDGVLDPVAWTTGRDDEGETVPLELRVALRPRRMARALGEFFRLCDEAGPDCAFSGDAEDRYEALADAARGGAPGPDGEDARSPPTRTWWPSPPGDVRAGVLVDFARSSPTSRRPPTAGHVASRPAHRPARRRRAGGPGPRAGGSQARAHPEPEPTPTRRSTRTSSSRARSAVACLDADDPRRTAVRDRGDGRGATCRTSAAFRVGGQRLLGVAGHRRGPLHRPLVGAHVLARARRRQLLRPGDPPRGRRGRLGPAAVVAAAHLRGLGTHRLPVWQLLRRPRGDELPRRRDAARPRRLLPPEGRRSGRSSGSAGHRARAAARALPDAALTALGRR